jgi:ubiquinone/menaquinone biosynthesis C-methylase UbiE
MTSASIAGAYDAIASEYDRLTQADHWMRTILWRHYERRFLAGQRILDLASGTGNDTLFLAHLGMQVTALDISAGMLAILDDKARRSGLSGRIEAIQGEITELDHLPAASFDGIVSAFAGLNTCGSLSRFAASARRILKPQGSLILHVLNRSSVWEAISLAARFRWAEAHRRWNQRERVFFIGGRPIHHYQFAPTEFYREFFQDEFDLVDMYGLGAVRPPIALANLPPAMHRLVNCIEGWAGKRRPLRDWGRFFVLDLSPRLPNGG